MKLTIMGRKKKGSANSDIKDGSSSKMTSPGKPPNPTTADGPELLDVPMADNLLKLHAEASDVRKYPNYQAVCVPLCLYTIPIMLINVHLPPHFTSVVLFRDTI